MGGRHKQRKRRGHVEQCNRNGTIKDGSHRAEKNRKVLMMKQAAKLGWAGVGAEKERGWRRSRAGQEHGQAGQKQGWEAGGQK